MTKERLEKLIESKIHEIFLEYQEDEDIADGGISPEHAVALDGIINNLSDLVVESMKDKKSLSCERFLADYDVDLHRIYYAMHACWYGTKDAAAMGLDKPYAQWAADWYEELSSSCLYRSDYEAEIQGALKHYNQQPNEEFDLYKLFKLYEGSDIEALEYMQKYSKGDMKALCDRLIWLNNHTTIGWGDIRATNDQSNEYATGKEVLLNSFGISLEMGEPVLSSRHSYTGEEPIRYLPFVTRSKVINYVCSEMKNNDVKADTLDIHNLLMNSQVCDLAKFGIDWQDVLADCAQPDHEEEEEDDKEL